MKVTVYHNSRCSKSRCAIDYLNENGIEYEVVEYLKNLPPKDELRNLIKKIGIKPEDLVRKVEEEYRDHFRGKSLTDDQWIDAMLRYPKLIERPIVLLGDKAVVARPADRIEELLDRI